ncbi:MAG TPA: hypothetical protein VFN37_10110 [Candidatus Baltobacteraceae bacterium]|nr:hypothetical protein [Candidatus Baltobacteraceae bacterium]
MSETQPGVVLNVNAYGATVRLQDGRLASAPAADVEKHRGYYDRGVLTRKPMAFIVQASERRPLVLLAPQLRDEQLEAQITGYLKSTQEWEAPEQPPAHERHFLRKKRRAALFESRHAPDR